MTINAAANRIQVVFCLLLLVLIVAVSVVKLGVVIGVLVGIWGGSLLSAALLTFFGNTTRK